MKINFKTDPIVAEQKLFSELNDTDVFFDYLCEFTPCTFMKIRTRADGINAVHLTTGSLLNFKENEVVEVPKCVLEVE